MIWNSWADFWNMGGYGLYVWGSYAFCVVGFVVELVLLRQRQKSVVAQIRDEHVGGAA